MGPKGAVEIIFRAETATGQVEARTEEYASASPTRSSRPARLHRRRDHAARDRRASPARCAGLRNEQLENPWKKHGNIPL